MITPKRNLEILFRDCKNEEDVVRQIRSLEVRYPHVEEEIKRMGIDANWDNDKVVIITDCVVRNPSVREPYIEIAHPLPDMPSLDDVISGKICGDEEQLRFENVPIDRLYTVCHGVRIDLGRIGFTSKVKKALDHEPFEGVDKLNRHVNELRLEKGRLETKLDKQRRELKERNEYFSQMLLDELNGIKGTWWYKLFTCFSGQPKNESESP